MTSELNFYERRILRVLSFSLRPLNTKEVAYYAKIDYGTASKYLKILKKNQKVRNDPFGGVNYWQLK